MSAESARRRREPDQKDEQGAFESLVRRLVAVPKKEIERKAKEYQQKRKEGTDGT